MKIKVDVPGLWRQSRPLAVGEIIEITDEEIAFFKGKATSIEESDDLSNSVDYETKVIKPKKGKKK